MRKHVVNCQIEEIEAHCLVEIQNDVNTLYVKLLADAMRRMRLTKKEQEEVINEIYKIYKNL